MSTSTLSAAGHPLAGFCSAWLNKIDLATAHKKTAYQQWADEAMKFFDGAMDSVMWDDANSVAGAGNPGGFLSRSSKGWQPTFRMTYNRMFEAVALFAPAMYFKNPNVQCTANVVPEVAPQLLGIDPNNPYAAEMFQQFQMQQQQEMLLRTQTAALYDTLLNWIQVAAGKKRESRMAICECLIKGASYLWTDVDYYQGGGRKIITSNHVSSDDILKDPDATTPRDVTWISRRCVHPVNIVEERFGLPPGSLKGHIQSFNQKSVERDKANKPIHAEGRTHDLIEYHEIYSKNGFGQMLSRGSLSIAGSNVSPIDVSQWGRYCKIVVARGIPYPLNVPTEMLQAVDPYGDEVIQAVGWPWPAWQDEPTGNGWPCVEFSLYEKAKSIWPVSIFKSVAGEMKFINWILSFMADRVASSCQTIVAVAKAAAAEFKKELFGANSPFSVIELADIMGKNINDTISFLNAPDLGTEIWNVVSAIDDKIDKRLGLTPLLYGNTPTQMRSAQEASIKDQMVSIRPDDMANSVEDCLSQVALKEAQCANFLLEGQDVAPVLGQAGAQVWDMFRQGFDPDTVVHGFMFRIEGGSSRKPNKADRAAKMEKVAAMVGPIAQQFAMQGMTGPFNAMVTELGKANEFDATPFLVQPFQPPQDNGGQVEQEQAQQEMALDADRHDQEMTQDQESHEMDMKQAAAKIKMMQAQAAAKSQTARARPKKAG